MAQHYKPGVFITVEGIEGAGKSTILPLIQAVLTNANIEFLATREPGGTPSAEKIRQIFLETDNEPLDAKTELLLIFAGRNQHVKHTIMPALNQGKWVLSDRFTDATYAYQGGGRGLGFDEIGQIEQFVLGEFHPHHILLLDLPVNVARERILARNALDRIEQESLDFFERIRQSYLRRAQQFPQRYSIIDAAQSLDEVKAQVTTAISKWVAKWQT